MIARRSEINSRFSDFEDILIDSDFLDNKLDVIMNPVLLVIAGMEQIDGRNHIYEKENIVIDLSVLFEVEP